MATVSWREMEFPDKRRSGWQQITKQPHKKKDLPLYLKTFTCGWSERFIFSPFYCWPRPYTLWSKIQQQIQTTSRASYWKMMCSQEKQKVILTYVRPTKFWEKKITILYSCWQQGNWGVRKHLVWFYPKKEEFTPIAIFIMFSGSLMMKRGRPPLTNVTLRHLQNTTVTGDAWALPSWY